MATAKSFSPRDMQALARWVVINGSPQKSERGKTFEIVGASLVLTNPLNRIDAHRYRRINLPFAIAEWLGMVYDNDDLSFYTKFVSSYGQYSTDGVTVDGAYGPRLAMPSDPRRSAIDEIVDTLTRTPESRRAVATIYSNVDLVGAGGKNTPCTISMQFLIRDNKLHMITNMRSNDIHYGLTNDVIVFTMLQEFIANRLGVGLGPYHHFAGSLHVYAELLSKFIKKQSETKEGRWPHTMAPMPKLFPMAEIDALYDGYRLLRPDKDLFYLQSVFDTMHEDYTRNLFCAAAVVVCRNSAPAIPSYFLQQITDPTIKRVSGFWLAKETK